MRSVTKRCACTLYGMYATISRAASRITASRSGPSGSCRCFSYSALKAGRLRAIARAVHPQNGPAAARIVDPFIDGVNIKLLKCGSFDAAVTMIAVAREHSLQILLGCMIETSLGTTAAARRRPAPRSLQNPVA